MAAVLFIYGMVAFSQGAVGTKSFIWKRQQNALTVDGVARIHRNDVPTDSVNELHRETTSTEDMPTRTVQQITYDLASLKRAIKGDVITPSDSEFWTQFYRQAQIGNPYPDGSKAIVIAKHAKDVQEYIKWCRNSGVTPVVKSGGQSLGGWGLYGEVPLILQGLDDVWEVNTSTKTLKVSAAYRMPDIYDRLQNEIPGYTLVASEAQYVGMGGYTPTGGLSYFSRAHGLTIDSVLEAEVVLPSGEIVTANAVNHPDLFWSLRGGGGGNFGIVTWYKVQLHPFPNGVHFVRLYFTNFSNYVPWTVASVEHAISQFRNTSTIAWQLANTAILGGGIDLMLQFFSKGSVADAQADLDGLLDVLNNAAPFAQGEPSVREKLNFNVSWSEVVKSNSNHSVQMEVVPIPFVPVGTMHSSWGANEAQLCLDTMLTTPGQVGLFLMGGAIADVAADATAFPWRSAKASTSFMIGLPSVEGKPSAIQTRDTMMAMPSTLGMYIGYLGADEVPGNWTKVFYGDNARRLIDTRAKYDPDRIFQGKFVIPVAGSD